MEPEATRPFRVLRAEACGRKEVLDRIVQEEPLHIVLNGEHLVSLLSLPAMQKELAIGFLLSEGIISRVEDITSLDVDNETGTVSVRATVDEKAIRDLFQARTLTTGCAGGVTGVNLEEPSRCKRINTAMRIPAELIPKRMKEFEKRSSVFLATGGAHSAAAATLEKIVYFAEDVGRHNALDKVVGQAALSGDRLSDKILLCTGRISTEMMVKVIRQKCPIVISRSAPTSRAIELAETFFVTLVGFARGRKFNVYSCPQRIEWKEVE